MTDRELPTVVHFPTMILGRAGAKGRNPAADHNECILERMRGVPANVGPSNPSEPGCPFGDPNAYPRIAVKLWRVIENEWNLKAAPWRDAVGIEEIDNDLAVPAIVCWFTRGHEPGLAEHVVELHNRALGQGVKER